MEIYYVEWFIDKDPIKFFETFERAQGFAHNLFEQQCLRPHNSNEFSVIGKLLDNGKKEIIVWQGWSSKLEEYKKQIEKEFNDFSCAMAKAITYYEYIANAN